VINSTLSLVIICIFLKAKARIARNSTTFQAATVYTVSPFGAKNQGPAYLNRTCHSQRSLGACMMQKFRNPDF
jgi:hypothetical protein